ncbi:MAG: Stp1/IreP family PP2C-type Ser/Thr phosphatase [Candidatus Krumholzibacteria bacterium]|nr:Stp1/IreP family PP2C-type Ser/Thr phosphatase [Candidatus Krumholzibacteria bacterium]
MKLEAASLSDIGQVRQKNEDATGRYHPEDEKELAEKGAIFVVADGMGGHRGGEIASELAVETVISLYYASNEKEPTESLRECFAEANKRILDKSTSEVDLFGMGTTCTTMVLCSGEAFFAHVGDSRAYVLRDGELQQLTEDHSLVGEMVRSGILSNEDAQHHPKRNVITRSLGTHVELRPDFPSTPYKLADGDVFVLCSDGLTSIVSDAEVRDILAANDPRTACRELVNIANAKGGKDNITVQVIKIIGAN